MAFSGTLGLAKSASHAVFAALRRGMPAGMMIGQLNGSMAGQTVFHLHFHIIPRYEAGGFRFHGKPAEDSSVLAEHAAAIRAHLPA